jgi:hypothetical protein
MAEPATNMSAPASATSLMFANPTPPSTSRRISYPDSTINFFASLIFCSDSHLQVEEDQPTGKGPHIHRGRNKGLASEARVDAHEEDDVDLVHHVLAIFQARAGSQYQARLQPKGSDKCEGSIHVVGSFRVKCDIRCSGLGKVCYHRIHWLHHQMHIDVLIYILNGKIASGFWKFLL